MRLEVKAKLGSEGFMRVGEQQKDFQWGIIGPGLHGSGCRQPCDLHQEYRALKEEAAEEVGEGCGAPSVRRQGALVPLQRWSLKP